MKMTFRLKNILLNMLAAVMLLAVISGCASTGTKSNTNTNTNTNTGSKETSQSSAPAASPSTKLQQTLTVGILPDVDSIPVIIAQQNGYFQKEGLQIKIEKFQSAKDRDTALQTGNLDGAISDMLAAAFAKEGNFDVKITSGTDGSYKLLVNKDLAIKDITELKGKGVAISQNTIIEYITDRVMEEAKLKSEDINKVIIPQMPTRLEMLNNGKVDAATLPEPLASSAMQDGSKLLNSSDKLGINPGILLFTTKSINAKENEIKAFYRAYNSAIEYLQKEPAASYSDMLVKEVGFPENIKASIKLPAYKKAYKPSEKDFDSVIKWLNGKSLIKNTFKYSDLVDERFVK